jgi:tripartite-type tricarboxylate transporter receptor subunit TctC
VMQRLSADGAEAAAPNRPEEFRKLIAAEIVKWDHVIQKLGLKK